MRQKETTAAGRRIIKVSFVSLIANAFLSVLKIVAGVAGGSYAVLSDGIDSASDVATSAVIIVTAGIMGRKPNKKYVYGYAKAESIATKILSMFIFFAGGQMLVSGIGHLAHWGDRDMPEPLAVYVTAASVLCKLGLSLYQSAEGKRTGSTMLSANAVNMRNDAITSASVLLGLVFTFVFELPVIDSIMSILVSCLILWSAFRIFMDSNVELMDGVRDTSMYQKIFEAIDRVDGVSNPHRVRSRTIGGKYMITLDVEADAGMTLMEAHTLASQVENEIRESIPEVYDIVVHVEPCGTHPEDVFGLGGKG